MIYFKFFVFILVISCKFVNSERQTLRGIIKPLNPTVLSAQGLDLSCSLHPNSTIHDVIVTSQHLFFSLGDITAFETKVIDDLTINVTLKNVSRSYSQVNLFCYANVSGHHYVVAQTKIATVEPLVTPNITGCIVSNWEHMACDWVPAHQDTGITTDAVMKFSYYCSSSFIQTCTDMHPGRCIFPMGHWVTYTNYCIMVCFNNSLSSTCSGTVQVHPKRIVKPGLVHELSLVTVDKRWVKLEWEEPYVDCHVMYYIELRVAKESKTWKTENTGILLEGLRPNFSYRVEVKSIPLVVSKENITDEVGYFSDVASQSFDTQPDVPGENPSLNPSSFYFDQISSKEGKVSVHVFWKPIPAESQNGILNFTSVRYDQISLSGSKTSGTFQEDTFNSDLKVVQLNSWLDRKVNYEVKVQIYNNVGRNDRIPPSMIIIPSLDRAPKPPHLFYAYLANKEIILEWKHVEGAHSYTVFSCPLHSSTKECMTTSTVYWSSVETNINKTTFQTSSRIPRIGISVEKFDRDLGQIISSGVLWTDCVHTTKNVLPPDNFYLNLHQPPKSLALLWVHPECTGTSFITNYEVLWCKKTPPGCHDNETGCCTGNYSTLVPNKLTSWVIKDLEPYSIYQARVRSISFDHASVFTDTVTHKVLDDGLSKAVLVLIIIASVLALVFLPVGIILIIWKGCNWYKRKIEITTPTGPSATNTEKYSGISEMKNMNANGYKEETDTGDTFTNDDAAQITRPLVCNGSCHPRNSDISSYSTVKPAVSPSPYAEQDDTFSLPPIPHTSPSSAVPPLPPKLPPSPSSSTPLLRRGLPVDITDTSEDHQLLLSSQSSRGDPLLSSPLPATDQNRTEPYSSHPLIATTIL